MEDKIVVNSIITPDGTRLISRHRHDYVTYMDKNGLEYAVDGGNDYLRRTVHDDHPFTEATLYFKDNIKEIIKYHCRGGRGKDGKQPLKWVPLCDMSNSWLKNCVEYNSEIGRGYTAYTLLYLRELDYRFQNDITVND